MQPLLASAEYIGTPYTVYQYRLDRLQQLHEKAVADQARLEAQASSLADLKLASLYNHELNPRLEQLQAAQQTLLERVERAERAAAEESAAAESTRQAEAHAHEVEELRAQLAAKDAEVRAAKAAGDLAIRQRQAQAMRRMLNLQLARGFTMWLTMAAERRRLMNATRRLRNPGLSRAMRSWHEMVEERRRLRNAAARMRNPALAHAVRAWRQLAIARAVAARSKAQEEGTTGLLRQQCTELQEALSRALSTAAAREEEVAVCQSELARSRRELSEGMAASKANMLEQRQAQAMRRMLNLQLARGFTMWVAMADERRWLMNATRRLRNPGLARAMASWLEMVEERRRLRNAAARMCNPALSRAVSVWRTVAVQEARRAAEAARSTASRRYDELHYRCEAAERALEEANLLMTEREYELKAELAGRDAELKRAEQELSERVAAFEKEARDAAMRQAMRRMLNLQLARGFRAWVGMVNERRRLMNATRRLRNPGLARAVTSWLEVVEERRRLRNAATRMRNPALSRAVSVWHEWAAAEVRRAQQGQYATLQAKLRHAEEESRWLREQSAAREVEHAHKVEELRTQLAAAEAEARTAKAANNEAIKRVQAQAMKRMLNLQLARGFTMWVAMADERRWLMNATRRLRNPGLARAMASWLEMVEERRRLRNAAARMRNPALAHAVRVWRQVAVASVRREAEARRREAEKKFAELQRHCEEVQRSLADRDAQSASVRRRLEEALTAGRQAVDSVGDDVDAA